MLDITILAVGVLRDGSLRTLASSYLKRLKPYSRVRVVELSAVPFTAGSRKKAETGEGKLIQEYLDKRAASNQPANVFLLAERGKSFDSLQFSKWIEKEQPIILVLGGALGFSSELYVRYPQISLSPLTFPHELARVVLLEQIYRAVTIANNKDYHY